MKRLHAAVLLLALPFLARAEDAPEPLQKLAEMAKSGTLFAKDSYKPVRGLCSALFEEQHKDDIKSAYGDDAEALNAWLDKHAEIKEEFYTAIDDKNDLVPKVLEIFHDLWKNSPEEVARFPDLAIAHAVVWDDPRGVYDYAGHQRRVRGIMPSGYTDFTALDSFRDFIARDREIKGKDGFDRLQALPWEFLAYVVNHRTPTDERRWAVKNYLTKRPMVGKVYGEIVYDTEMLRTQSKVCKLNDQPYTLDSILKHGGVCAMQADFAARVGKSLAVPAAYVSGESQFQDLHAWVMWVEVRSVSGGQVAFSLESNGRYLGDNYYTGHLEDPQTGQRILDRDMERRLHAVSVNRVGKRQAELGMKYYGPICELRGYDTKTKILFLDRCLSLSPFNEAAWFELVRQVKGGELDAALKPIVLSHVESMMKVFAKYPDFTWSVAPDLMGIQPNKAAQVQFFGKLVALYETAGRPDLACEARLKWADLQIDEDHWKEAAQGLASTIQKFPAEGRYVPKLIDKLRDVCASFKGGTDYMAAQYVALVQKIPPKRGQDPSKFYAQMYAQAQTYLKDNKKDKQLKELERSSPTKGKN